MKKLLPIILCLVLVCGLFTACSNNIDEEETTDPTSSTGITTDDAKITEGDAIRLIESYTADELGITDDVKNECTFLVANSGEEIEGKYYIKVIAAIKQQHVDQETNKTTFTFDEKGAYFISYDGTEILSLNSQTSEYSQMQVREVPTTQPVTTHDHTHADEAE